MRISLEELLTFERSGHVRWIEPKNFSLAGGRLPQLDFVLEFEALSGRIYVCAVTKVDPDAVQVDCPAENVAGIWFADIAALKDDAVLAGTSRQAAPKPAKRAGSGRD